MPLSPKEAAKLFGANLDTPTVRKASKTALKTEPVPASKKEEAKPKPPRIGGDLDLRHSRLDVELWDKVDSPLVAKGNPAPAILKLPDSVTINQNQTVALAAKIEGSPAPTVVWMKNGQEITTGERVKMIVDGTKGEVSLILNDACLNDAGLYSLILESTNGNDQADLTLSIHEKRIGGDVDQRQSNQNAATFITNQNQSLPAAGKFPRIIELPDSVTVNRDQSMVFVAKIEGDPVPNVKWFRDGQCLAHDGHRVTMGSDGNTGKVTLLIKQVAMADSGSYTLQLESPIGKDEAQTNLVVLPPRIGGELDLRGANLSCRQPDFCETEGSNRSQSEVEGAMSRIIELPDSVLINRGQSVALTAKIVGDPTATVTWMRNGQPVEIGNRMKCLKRSGRTSFIIEQVTESDHGDYSLVLESKSGRDEQLVKLVVFEPRIGGHVDLRGSAVGPDLFQKVSVAPVASGRKPRILAFPDSVTVNSRQTAALIAKIEGDPVPQIKWLRNGAQIVEGERVKMFSDATGKVALMIDQVCGADQGEYQLVVESSEGRDQGRTTLIIDDSNFTKPTFIANSEPNSTNAKEGDSVTFRCEVDDSSGVPSTVTWWHKSVQVQPDINHIMRTRNNLHELIVRRTSCVEDQGEYIAVAANKYGDNRQAYQLRVNKVEKDRFKHPVHQDEPDCAPKFMFHLRPRIIQEKQDCKLTAMFKAKPAPKITWYKDGKPLVIDGDRLVESGAAGVAELHIRLLKSEQAGEYEVRAENSLGIDSSSTVVHVQQGRRRSTKPMVNGDSYIMFNGDKLKLIDEER